MKRNLKKKKKKKFLKKINKTVVQTQLTKTNERE